MTQLSTADLKALTLRVHEAALAAGEMALGYFRRGAPTAARVWTKQGGSPVTEADTSVDSFLKVSCAMALPEAGWLSEETADDPGRLGRRLVWVVDPIDGTRAFMGGLEDWCVCVALLADDVPILGVVHAPALGVTYQAVRGDGARRNGALIQTAALGPEPRIAGPKPMLDALSRHVAFAPQPKVPSLALRLTRIAEGRFDGGLISPDSRDWDLAAADLVLQEAGGRLSTLENADVRYNRPQPVHGTLLAASQAFQPHLLAAAQAMSARRVTLSKP